MTFDEVELRVGDRLIIGTHIITVLEIEGDEAVFRIDEHSPAPRETVRAPRPR